VGLLYLALAAAIPQNQPAGDSREQEEYGQVSTGALQVFPYRNQQRRHRIPPERLFPPTGMQSACQSGRVVQISSQDLRLRVPNCGRRLLVLNYPPHCVVLREDFSSIIPQ
jgi:hypothetical protein